MRTFLAPAVAAALLAVTGCGIQGEPPSAKRLAALTSRNVQMDYTPLASPRDALTKGDLVAVGTLTDIIDVVAVTHTNPRRASVCPAPTRRSCSPWTRSSPATRRSSAIAVST